MMINFAYVFSYIAKCLNSSLKFELFPPLRNAQTGSVLNYSSCNPAFIERVNQLLWSKGSFLIFSNPVSSKGLLNFDSCCYFVHYFGEKHHKYLIRKIQIILPNDIT